MFSRARIMRKDTIFYEKELYFELGHNMRPAKFVAYTTNDITSTIPTSFTTNSFNTTPSSSISVAFPTSVTNTNTSTNTNLFWDTFYSLLCKKV